MRYYRENGNDTANVEGFMTGSYGPCRLGKYAIEHMRILREIGFDLPLLITVSNNAYGDFNLGTAFERHMWRGIVAVDYLQKLVWRTRPYEKQKGTTDGLFRGYLDRIADCQRARGNLRGILRQATSDFRSLADSSVPRRPLVGINGEVFLRLNEFSNRNLARVCEDAGLEVVVSPVSEWIRYTAYRNLEDAAKTKNLSRIVRSFIRKNIVEHDEHFVAQCFGSIADGKEPTTAQLLSRSSHYISPRCGSEAVLSTGSGIEWMESPEFAGVISVMPHGCMPGGIVAAMADKFSTIYNKPWISLTYDGFQESTNLARINEFAELVRFCQKDED
jgi:predicted nucleotide-binding protein (sugar kinase/HSP70/actin superfamily)